MSRHSNSAVEAVAALRLAFDETFAQPIHHPDKENLEAMLLIRAAGEAFALRSLQIGRLARIGLVVPIPSRIRELLGICAIRGTLTPVFDLAALLGFDAGNARPSWTVLTRGDSPVAFAFDQFEGQVEIRRNSLHRHQDMQARPHVSEVLRIDGGIRDVIDIPALLETIRQRARVINPEKES